MSNTQNAQAVGLAAVTKRYGDDLAVDAISLKIPAGSYCCLLGPSGCGKTSTLRMIAGHEGITDGDIMIGSRIVNDDPPAQRGTAMMFQSYALFPHLSVAENVAFSLRMKGMNREKRLARAQDMLRADDIDILAEDEAATAQRRATVSEIEYRGPDVRLGLETEGGETLIAAMGERAFFDRPLAAGRSKPHRACPHPRR